MSDTVDQLGRALAGRYTIQRELGRGGMATVYLATDLKHERAVALKVLKPELAAALGADRFLREIKTTAQLTHPHILPLYDSGQAGPGAAPADDRPPAADILFYVMPFVEGESLRDRLDREKQLPVEDALRIAREVADALSYAHARGVIHRDIKPENILLEAGHAVVADFGIARAVDQAGGDRLTTTGVALGTPAYMSPEQAAGSSELDGRSDLYALGCVLYEMLAGQPPFTGPTVESQIQQHLAAEPPNITGIRPAVPAHVVATLERALAKTPADRFNPVALFAEALTPGRATASNARPATGRTPARRWPWERVVLMGIAAVVLLAGAAWTIRRLGPSPAGAGPPRTAIAVLPFQNLTADESRAFFASGLHDELLTQLARVATLKVISRTSVLGYVGTTKSLTAIAQELGVGSIVEGSVQAEGDRLRVNVQLIDASTDEHLWAQRYDRTLDDAFAIQSEVAQHVVDAIGAVLGETERTALAEAPTENAEAYRLYLQGTEYFRRPGASRRNFEIAQDFFERAVRLDPTFALAHAALSDLHGRMWWFRFDPSSERLTRQRQAAETALRLAPTLPQAHLAAGYVEYVAGDWTEALRQYQRTLEGMPNAAGAWERIANAHRRLGNWDEALSGLQKTAELDPRNADALLAVGSTLLAMRRYREGLDWVDRSAALAPDVAEIDVFSAWGWMLWQGSFDSLAAALDRHGPDVELGDWGTGHTWQAYRLYGERKADSLLSLIARIPEPVFDRQVSYLPTALYAAWAHELRGDRAAARTAFGSARVLLDSVVAELPDDWRIHAALGLALAGLGRREDALREARWLEASAYYREDRFQGALAVQARGLILAQAGDADGAIAEIERLLAGPAYGFSVHLLRLDPRWDPIRDDPRFQRLLTGGG